MPQQTLAGVIERVAYHDEETGFCVLRVRTSEPPREVTIVGRIPAVNSGEYVDAIGEWVHDSKHGQQFRAEDLRVAPPGTAEGIERYLASGLVEGIGPELARRLVAAFGDEVFDVIERRPGLLREVPGIGPERQKRITLAWSEQTAVRDIMVFLHSHGVGTARATRIFRVYGTEALDIVRRNPYRLATDIPGIGFPTADRIAERLGIRRDSPLRAAAGLLYQLTERAGAGHCATPKSAWLDQTAEALDIGREVVEEAARAVTDAGEVVIDTITTAGEPAVPCAYLTRLHRAETGVADSLAGLLTGTHPVGVVDPDRVIDTAESRVRLRLAPSQRAALRAALTSKVVVITGGPGVGKTTIVRALVEIVRAHGLRCRLAAPTGRAARRLAETARSEARTVHRLLEVKGRGRGFAHDEHRPLAGDVFIVDEASMLDVYLCRALLRALPTHAALVLVGDVDQLPSVGPGQVLRDLIDSHAVPAAQLSEIFRQDATSHIVTAAHGIQRGELPDLSYPAGVIGDFYFIECEAPEDIAGTVDRLIRERIPQRFGLDPVRDVQVLSPMKRSILGTEALNSRLQELLNSSSLANVKRHGTSFRTGDKVMQTENDYDKDVFNGDVGRVVSIDESDRSVQVDFDGRGIRYTFGELDELSLAYAISIHKSQGSEYPAVIIPLHTQHFMLLYRNVLYTGVTRARRLLVIVGSRRALRLAVEREDPSRRLTGLCERLRASPPRSDPL